MSRHRLCRHHHLRHHHRKIGWMLIKKPENQKKRSKHLSGCQDPLAKRQMTTFTDPPAEIPAEIQPSNDMPPNRFYDLPAEIQERIFIIRGLMVHKEKSAGFLEEIRTLQWCLEERWLEWSDEDLHRMKKLDFHNDLWERTLYTLTVSSEFKEFNDFKIWLMKYPVPWRTRRTYSVRCRWSGIYQVGMRGSYMHLKDNPYFALWKNFMQYYFD